MTWARLLASNIVTALPATKAEIDNLRITGTNPPRSGLCPPQTLEHGEYPGPGRQQQTHAPLVAAGKAAIQLGEIAKLCRQPFKLSHQYTA